jgi:hypothetical protein
MRLDVGALLLRDVILAPDARGSHNGPTSPTPAPRSKFKAVNNRDKNFTRAKMERRMAQIEESVARLSSSTLPTGRNIQRRYKPRRTVSKRRSRR